MTPLIRRFAAALIALLVVVAGCSAGDARPLKYLQTLPEDVLAYPGSTLTCNVGSPEKPGIDDPGWATSTQCYTAPASESTVVAWYADELADRGWRRLDQYFSDGGTMPEWRKEFVALQMKRVNIADDKDPNPFVFTVGLLALGSNYDSAPISGLLALPEIELAYPGSTPTRMAPLGRSTDADSVRPATVNGLAETPASVAEVEQYFDREFLARGWRAVDPPPTDMRFGWNATLAWQTDDVMAGLAASTIRSGTIYRFAIAEVLGPDQTPGLPWE